MRALITGITGQDGSYLAELLIKNKYEVHGIVRGNNLNKENEVLKNISHIKDKLKLHKGSIEDNYKIEQIIKNVRPDECYHMAAQSFVSISPKHELSTINVNISGTHNILSCIKKHRPDCKVYFSGSSEMFGKVKQIPQNEKTFFRPRSIYGLSKLTGYELARYYRENYNLFVSVGILYNHESPRRGIQYVSRKITNEAAKIKLGLSNSITLGNIEAKRDWGFAGDYVIAMKKMLNKNEPDDYVIGTDELHTVKDILKIAFKDLGLNYKKYIKIDKRFYRPNDEFVLVSDSSYARTKLNWKPSMNFENLILMMVRSDYNNLKIQN